MATILKLQIKMIAAYVLYRENLFHLEACGMKLQKERNLGIKLRKKQDKIVRKIPMFLQMNCYGDF